MYIIVINNINVDLQSKTGKNSVMLGVSICFCFFLQLRQSRLFLLRQVTAAPAIILLSLRFLVLLLIVFVISFSRNLHSVALRCFCVNILLLSTSTFNFGMRKGGLGLSNRAKSAFNSILASVCVMVWMARHPLKSLLWNVEVASLNLYTFQLDYL